MRTRPARNTPQGLRMPPKKKSPRPNAKNNGPQTLRLWLMYPPKQITAPVIWELGHKFPITTNVRQASFTDEIGIVSLSLKGEREEIKRAITWLEELGVKVEPVEMNTIEG